jgi:hypothetical protein
MLHYEAVLFLFFLIQYFETQDIAGKDARQVPERTNTRRLISSILSMFLSSIVNASAGLH